MKKNNKSYVGMVYKFLKINTRQYAMIIALLLIWLVFSVLTNFVFLTPRNLSNLFIQSTTVAILSIGMTLVVVSGHLDLSCGSVLGFCGAVASVLMIRFGLGISSVLFATVFIGGLIGLWQGYWIGYKKISSIIVTLSSMIIFRGAIIGITGGQTLGLEMASSQTANIFRKIGQGYLPRINKSLPFHDTTLYLVLSLILLFWIFDFSKRKEKIRYGFDVLPLRINIIKNILISTGILIIASIMIFYMGAPYCVILVIILTCIFDFITKNTTFGRHLYAIGSDIEAARLAGINVKSKVLYLFVVMGIITAIAGIVYTSRLNAATTSAGVNFELDAIASAAIGGASFLGGEGTIPGAVIGALVMASVDNGMSLLNLDITFQYIIKGLILLLAVWLDMISRRKSIHL
jgi:D-xylose transport system permease protein